MAVSKEERDIMADMFYFLRDHNNPPRPGTDESVIFWEKAAKDIGDLVGGKWNNDKLATNIAIALYTYIEEKGKM